MANGKRSGAKAIHPVLFTDPRVHEADLAHALRRLPRLAWVVFRHYELEPKARAALFAKLRGIARRRCVRIFVAGALPTRFADYDGVHIGSARRGSRRNLTLRGHRPITAAVHSMTELAAAHSAGAWVVFISPVFATNSHKGVRGIGPLAYRRMAKRARKMGMMPLPLGGMTEARARMMKAAGFGAIDGLL